MKNRFLQAGSRSALGPAGPIDKNDLLLADSLGLEARTQAMLCYIIAHHIRYCAHIRTHTHTHTHTASVTPQDLTQSSPNTMYECRFCELPHETSGALAAHERRDLKWCRRTREVRDRAVQVAQNAHAEELARLKATHATELARSVHTSTPDLSAALTELAELRKKTRENDAMADISQKLSALQQQAPTQQDMRDVLAEVKKLASVSQPAQSLLEDIKRLSAPVPPPIWLGQITPHTFVRNNWFPPCVPRPPHNVYPQIGSVYIDLRGRNVYQWIRSNESSSAEWVHNTRLELA